MKQEMKQELAQAVQTEAPEEVMQEEKQDASQDAAQTSLKTAGIIVNLPGTKTRPVLSTVSMRLSSEVKSQLKAMAKRRGMSLGEFCATVMADVAAQAGEAEKTEAA